MRKMINPIKIFQAWDLNRKQEKLNKEFEEQGFTDEILEKQVELNQKRNKLDITDKSEVVNDEGFVQ